MSEPSPALFSALPCALSMGPQRAATSWIDRYLRWRGDVCLPASVKETYFFNRFYGKGVDYYAGHFRPAPAHRLIMEVTAQSFDCPDAPARVRHVMGPAVRLLCPLRHPVSRSYSLYLHYRRYGIVQGSLPDAARSCPQILTSSHYTDHLARWFDVFGQDAMTLVWQEDLERDAAGFVDDICAALNLPFMPSGGEIAARCNASVEAPHPVLARHAQQCAEWLRARRFYAPINAAKGLGLKRWVFGADDAGGGCAVPPDDFAWLAEKLAPAMKQFEKLTGRSLPDCVRVQDDLARAV